MCMRAYCQSVPIQSSSHSLSPFPPSMQLYLFIQLLFENATVRKRSFDLLLDASMICVWIYSSLEFTVPIASQPLMKLIRLSYYDVNTYMYIYIFIYMYIYIHTYIYISTCTDRGVRKSNDKHPLSRGSMQVLTPVFVTQIHICILCIRKFISVRVCACI